MLSEKTQRALLKQLKFDDAKITELMKTGDFDVDVPKHHVFNDDELNTLKTNVKKGHEEAYPEIWGKKLNEELGLGLTSSDAKDHAKLLDAHKNKVLKDANISVDEKVKEVTKDLEKVRGLVAERENELKTFQQKLKEREVYDTYRSMLPEKRNKFLTDDEHITRLKAKLQLDEKGLPINPATGEPYKDKLASVRTAKEVVDEIYTTNEGWLHPETLGTNAPKNGTLGLRNGASGSGAKTMSDPLELANKAMELYPDDARMRSDYMRTEQLKTATT